MWVRAVVAIRPTVGRIAPIALYRRPKYAHEREREKKCSMLAEGHVRSILSMRALFHGEKKAKKKRGASAALAEKKIVYSIPSNVAEA